MAAKVTLLLLAVFHMAVLGIAGGPPAGTVSIAHVSYNGNGCPSGSTEVILSSDLQSLTAIYSQYTAYTPGPVANRRRYCTVSVGLKYPTGFTFAVGTVTYRGFAQLDKGVVGTLAASYYFAGTTETAKTFRKLPSPFNNNFEFSDKFLTAVYTPCGLTAPRNLVLKSEVRVVPKAKMSGLVTVDSQDLSLKQIFRLNWKNC
eukprot:TRINITY_DN7716_c0_g1_i1.p1 TRINITY_DN7716_c0_g1~~TRINITY_DN7716_c0_g1_i1.p1  ORF type:complete len:202 (+),score=24.43 TRINITY_DN7716_c0_g1_i1:261-866(+)